MAENPTTTVPVDAVYEEMFNEITRKLYGEGVGNDTNAAQATTVAEQPSSTNMQIDHSPETRMDIDENNSIDNIADRTLTNTTNTAAWLNNGNIALQQQQKNSVQLTRMINENFYNQNTNPFFKTNTTNELFYTGPSTSTYMQQQQHQQQQQQQLEQQFPLNLCISESHLTPLNLCTSNSSSSSSTSSSSMENTKSLNIGNKNFEISSIKIRYTCPRCPYAADRYDVCAHHAMTSHSIDKPFQCYVCFKEFQQEDSVRRHFVRVHRDMQFDSSKVKNCLLFGMGDITIVHVDVGDGHYYGAGASNTANTMMTPPILGQQQQPTLPTHNIAGTTLLSLPQMQQQNNGNGLLVTNQVAAAMNMQTKPLEQYQFVAQPLNTISTNFLRPGVLHGLNIPANNQNLFSNIASSPLEINKANAPLTILNNNSVYNSSTITNSLPSIETTSTSYKTTSDEDTSSSLLEINKANAPLNILNINSDYNSSTITNSLPSVETTSTSYQTTSDDDTSSPSLEINKANAPLTILNNSSDNTSSTITNSIPSVETTSTSYQTTSDDDSSSSLLEFNKANAPLTILNNNSDYTSSTITSSLPSVETTSTSYKTTSDDDTLSSPIKLDIGASYALKSFLKMRDEFTAAATDPTTKSDNTSEQYYSNLQCNKENMQMNCEDINTAKQCEQQHKKFKNETTEGVEYLKNKEDSNGNNETNNDSIQKSPPVSLKTDRDLALESYKVIPLKKQWLGRARAEEAAAVAAAAALSSPSPSPSSSSSSSSLNVADAAPKKTRRSAMIDYRKPRKKDVKEMKAILPLLSDFITRSQNIIEILG